MLQKLNLAQLKTISILVISIISQLLAACSPVATALPTSTATFSPTYTMQPTLTLVPTYTLEQELSAMPVAILDNNFINQLVSENPDDYQPFVDLINQTVQSKYDWSNYTINDFDILAVLFNENRPQKNEWIIFGTIDGQTWVISQNNQLKNEMIIKPLVKTKENDITKLMIDNLSIIEIEPEGNVFVRRMDGTLVDMQISIQEDYLKTAVSLDADLGIVSASYANNIMSGFDLEGNLLATYDFKNREWVISLKEGQEILQLLPEIKPIIVNSQARLEEGRVTINFSSAVTTERGINSIRVAIPGVLSSTYETILNKNFTKYHHDPNKPVKLMGFYQDTSGISIEGSIVGKVDKVRLTVVNQEEFDRSQNALQQAGVDFIGFSQLGILKRNPIILAWFEDQCLNVVHVVSTKGGLESGEEGGWVIGNAITPIAWVVDVGLMAASGQFVPIGFEYVYRAMRMSFGTLQTPVLEFD